MGLKTYSLRLDEDEFEKLKKSLSEYGDPDLNIGFVLRAYIRDLNRAIPSLRKSTWGLRNNLSVFGSMLKEMDRLIDIELIVKGKGPKLSRIVKEEKE